MLLQPSRVRFCAGFWLAMIIAGCGGPSPGAVSSPDHEPSAASTRTTDGAPSPVATIQPTQSHEPSLAPVGTESPFAWYPWLPPIDQGVEASLAVDTFVRTTAVVPVSADPGGRPYRFDTGEPDPSRHPLNGFPGAALLTVVHGPVLVDGVEWYLLTPAQIAIDIPTGWSPLTAPDGGPHFASTTIECPSSPISSERLSAMALTDGLPACYGATQVTIVGWLECGRDEDPFVTGPAWLRTGRCGFEGPPTVYGLDPNLPDGRYAVVGHFLDPEATTCRPRDEPDSPEARLTAVLFCRRAFVATSVEPG